MPVASTVHAREKRLDWREVREQASIEAVAVALMGEPSGRRGASGLWYVCPFHADVNPSLNVDPIRDRWRCFGCGEHGDAAELVVRMEGLPFADAVRRVAEICGLSPSSGDFQAPSRPTPAKAPERPKAGPSGLPPGEASALVEDAARRLWTAEGAKALSYLHDRGLEDETIRSARLGFAGRVSVPSRAGGRVFHASGVCVPWFDDGRLRLVKVRRLDDGKPKYIEAFRDDPRVFPSLEAIDPGRPLVACEGEFDALLLHQLIGDVACVITLGSASGPADPDVFRAVRSASMIFAAHDADDAGDRAAAKWPTRSVRVRPPSPFKDWTDVRRAAPSLARHEFGRYLPMSMSWGVLKDLRWGDPDAFPDLGCVADENRDGEEL